MLLQSAQLAAGIAGVLGAAAGAVLLFVPRRYLEVESPFRQLLLEADLGKLFNRRFAIERQAYRRHRWVGVAVLSGAFATASLLSFFAYYPKAAQRLSSLLGSSGSRAALLLIATLTALLLVVGALLVIRPSILKGIEAASNRWIDTIPEQGSHAIVSRFVLRAPRLVGGLLVVAGLACLGPL